MLSIVRKYHLMVQLLLCFAAFLYALPLVLPYHLPYYATSGMLTRIVSDKAADVINIKISKVGGLTRARAIRDLAVSCGIAMNIEDTWYATLARNTYSMEERRKWLEGRRMAGGGGGSGLGGEGCMRIISPEIRSYLLLLASRLTSPITLMLVLYVVFILLQFYLPFVAYLPFFRGGDIVTAAISHLAHSTPSDYLFCR